jgi:hypothetical protein
MPPRRLVLRAAFTVGVIAGTAGALVPVLTRTSRTGKNSAPDLERFAEMYRGRDIHGTATAMVPAAGHAGAASAAEAGAMAVPPGIDVRIDGRPLHVMKRADGSYLSTVNHYESFPTLLEAARAAVDEIGSAQLSMVSPHSI